MFVEPYPSLLNYWLLIDSREEAVIVLSHYLLRSNRDKRVSRGELIINSTLYVGDITEQNKRLMNWRTRGVAQ